jgi:hypothetical protein
MAGATGAGRLMPVGLLQPSVTSRMSSNGRPAMRLATLGWCDMYKGDVVLAPCGGVSNVAMVS